MKKVILLFLTIILITSSGSFAAGYIVGNDLLSSCSGEEPHEQLLCYGYIASVQDTIETLSDWEVVSKPFCMPNAVTVGQASTVFLKYANNHPEMLHYTASGLVISSMIEAFPCE